MRCEEFDERLNDLLDRREPPESDTELRDHAKRCNRCAETFQLWTAIAGVSECSPPVIAKGQQETANLKRVSMLASYALAAVLLIAIGIQFGTSKLGQVATVAQVAPTRIVPYAGHDVVSETQPPAEGEAFAEDIELLVSWDGGDVLWNFVDEDVFVSSTRPAFETVRVGVEPLSRSMKRAIAILMSQSTPSVESGTPESTPVSFREQTSMDQMPMLGVLA
ncbi:zf-HC2 domain-containing protein [Stieleria sp. JC731]|uniref:zf-HC2 domain-containing protein n=1 Tax=Pirellulaceae TaxID=2691357 RepID=UPI001E64DC0C|nr:zf-HC2 domain-containing protein [Stieleria sp. JC731]MCC9599623.1 zf-HC2 domain-containing protein [Stieleria sp. JC731]